MALFSRWMLVGIMALFPAVGHALALGKLKVLSALNEPLNAEIEFTSITDKELKGLSVTLASRADFEAAGVERLAFLSQVKFVIDQRPDGRHFLQLRTDQQIDEPFLHLLLQVEWPGGRLVREYTALIDPPYKIAGKAAPVETPVVTPPAPEPVPAPMPALEPAPMAEAPPADMMKEEIPPVVAQPEEQKAPEEPKAEAALPKEEVAQEVPPPAEAMPEGKFGPPDVATGMAPEEPGAPMVEPLEAVPTAETAPEAQPTAEPEAAPALAQMTDYHVRRGDTLWRIAEQARADNRDVSVEQMILAIYRPTRMLFSATTSTT
jgi:pilus assembly protein FimV